LEKAELYDLVSDIRESADLAEKKSKMLQKLEAEAEKAREELGDALTKRKGRGVREPGRLPPDAS
jgi:arylsulfatase A